jgi:hypothetical protein
LEVGSWNIGARRMINEFIIETVSEEEFKNQHSYKGGKDLDIYVIEPEVIKVKFTDLNNGQTRIEFIIAEKDKLDETANLKIIGEGILTFKISNYAEYGEFKGDKELFVPLLKSSYANSIDVDNSKIEYIKECMGCFYMFKIL